LVATIAMISQWVGPSINQLVIAIAQRFALEGAIFYENEKEIELSFDQAFREVNNMKFSELRFVTIKRYMPTNDSFLLQQISK